MGCPLTIGARTSGRKLTENDQRVLTDFSLLAGVISLPRKDLRLDQNVKRIRRWWIQNLVSSKLSSFLCFEAYTSTTNYCHVMLFISAADKARELETIAK